MTFIDQFVILHKQIVEAMLYICIEYICQAVSHFKNTNISNNTGMQHKTVLLTITQQARSIWN